MQPVLSGIYFVLVVKNLDIWDSS